MADRGDVLGFAAAVRPTIPAPEPLDVLSVIHETGDCAVHAHPNPAETKMLLVAMPPLTVTAVGDVE